MTNQTEALLLEALARMDRARDILTDGKPTPVCNWGMLATEDLRAALNSQPPAPNWQPIETAPKDGTRFLAYRRGDIADAYRVRRDDCEMWVFGREIASVESWPQIKPSFWMPLPADPASLTGTASTGGKE